MAEGPETEPLTEGKEKKPEAPMSQFEKIIMIFTLIFWSSCLFFGFYTTRYELYESHEVGFKWIKSLADGIMLISITLIGSYLALREFVIEVKQLLYKILLMFAEVILMFA